MEKTTKSATFCLPTQNQVTVKWLQTFFLIWIQFKWNVTSGSQTGRTFSSIWQDDRGSVTNPMVVSMHISLQCPCKGSTLSFVITQGEQIVSYPSLKQLVPGLEK